MFIRLLRSVDGFPRVNKVPQVLSPIVNQFADTANVLGEQMKLCATTRERGEVLMPEIFKKFGIPEIIDTVIQDTGKIDKFDSKTRRRLKKKWALRLYIKLQWISVYQSIFGVRN